MAKKKATIQRWHNIEIVGAILGLILLLSLISILQFSSLSEASSLPTYYVSSLTGNDAYSGSESEPFKTVQGATKRLTDERVESRSARIVILGEYREAITLDGLGYIVLEPKTGSGGRITGVNSGSGTNLGLVTIKNVRRVDIKGLELIPSDSTRPIVITEVTNEAPRILNIEQNTFSGSEAVRIFNNNEGLAAGSLKLALRGNVFKINEASSESLVTDVATLTPRSKGLSVYLEAQSNFFEGYGAGSVPVFNLDEISGYAKMWDNTFLARGQLMLASELVKLSPNIIAENDLLSDNRFGQLSQ